MLVLHLNLQLAMKLGPQMTSNFSIKLVNSRQDMKYVWMAKVGNQKCTPHCKSI